MRNSAAWFLIFLVSACAAPAPSFVAPSVSGKSNLEVSKFVAASEAKLFPCKILAVEGADGADTVDLGGSYREEITLPPGRYRVTLICTSGYHTFKPEVGVVARVGKSYRLTGYLIDDSITIFNMKMRVRVAELP